MVVVAHQAECREPPTLPENFLGEPVKENQTLFVIFEDGFLSVSARGQLVAGTRKLHT